MDDQRLRRTAALSVAQVVIAGGALVFFYRYLIDAIGVAAVGVWGVVLATTSVGRMADFGLSGGISRFVAKARAQGNMVGAAIYVETAAVSSGIASGLLVAVAFPVLNAYLSAVLPENSLPVAMAMLPYALFAFWTTSVAGVYLGGLDGVLRVDLRNLLMIASSVLQVGFGILFVHSNGIMGLAYAQATQALIVLCLTLVVLRRTLPTLSPVPVKWDSAILRELLGFGWKLQVTSIAVLLFEPVTKGLLARFGGLASAGYYEMATRMVQQVRAILVNANQVLVPAVADASERDPLRARRLYNASYRVVLFLVLPVIGGLVVSLPAVSQLWIGHYEERFITFAAMLAVGWFFNSLTGPSYFAAIGAGHMRWNLLGHVAIAVLNLPASYALGRAFGGTGVVAGAMASLMAGSALVTIGNHRDQDEPMSALVPPGTLLLFMASLAGVASGLLCYSILHPHLNTPLSLLLSMAVWLMIIALPAWRHPVRAKLLRSIGTLLQVSPGRFGKRVPWRKRVTAWIVGS